MSYLVQSRLAHDPHIIDRLTACAAGEGIADPQGWVFAHQWQFSAQPGWDAAYATAELNGDEKPGTNEAAITDGMILAAVQAIRGRA